MKKKWLLAITVVVTLVLSIGVAPVSAAPHRCEIVHIVQPGETLYSLARRYGVDVWTLASANGLVNPNRIYVGQRLCIPTHRPAGVVHVVQPGETLSGIALRYGVSMWALAAANNLTNPNHIYVGQYLSIPGGMPYPHPRPHPAPPPQPQPQPQPQSCPSDSLPGPWSGEYFDNLTLSGTAYTTRQDDEINFNWGWGAPAGGMPSSYFSVRWTGTFHFAAETYRFYAKVDDGVRVYVDGVLIIDGWRDGPYRSYNADRTLSAGDHTVEVQYYDRIQVARICFWWDQLTGATPTPSPTPPCGATPTPTVVPPSDQWYGEFFNNEDLQGSPAATRYDPWIGFDWGTDGPMSGVWCEGFSARWTRILPLSTDHYRFCAMSDDGARIWVNGQLVLDEWHANNGTAYCGTYWATSGNYEVKVEYYEHGGDALIYVWWEPH
jgi:LysM repeat protein